MEDVRILRIGAVAAATGAVTQLVATVLEPDWGGDPSEAVRVVANSGVWITGRLLDLVGVFLIVGALTVVGRTFTERPGKEWARLGQPFLVLMGALGVGAVLAGANMKEVADSWAETTPAATQSYLAAFDAATNWTDALFFGAFMALGLYLATLAAAILTGGVYARWTGWASAASAALLLPGDVLLLASDTAFIAVLAGFLLFTAVLVALGTSLWRQASAVEGRERAHLADRGDRFVEESTDTRRHQTGRV